MRQRRRHHVHDAGRPLDLAARRRTAADNQETVADFRNVLAVAVARALANRPKLVLADEPTGNLDTRSGERVGTLLFDMNNKLGTTLVLVTHDKELASRCDRIIEIDSGQLVG